MKGEIDRRLDVGPGHHAIAADVGVNDRRHAGVLELERQIERLDARGFGPTLDRDEAAARIDADDDATGMKLARRLDQFGVFERGRAEDAARRARFEPRGYGRQIADSAAD